MNDFNAPKNSETTFDFSKGFDQYTPDAVKQYAEDSNSNFERQSGLIGKIDAVAQATDPQAHLDQLKSSRSSAKERTEKFMSNSRNAAAAKEEERRAAEKQNSKS